ncbi:MAK10-like protein [Tanacetum coccineum]
MASYDSSPLNSLRFPSAAKSRSIQVHLDVVGTPRQDSGLFIVHSRNRLGRLDHGIVKNVEVHVGKLKLVEDFHVVDMKREPTCPLLVGRGFLATTGAMIDHRKAKIAVGEGITVDPNPRSIP